MDKPLIIAYYLPQYHPIPENDEWWGKGFTEWTNVARAKPLFKGHYQPKIPADLGFYDLRVPEVREQQAELAREAGVDGFCYWHYWFGNGKQLLERPFREVLESGKPNFPFCLGWANESWESKIWSKDGVKSKKILIEQTYPGIEDIDNHFYSLVKAFKDPRYIRIENQPIFHIYQPLNHPNIKFFIDRWNYLVKKENIASKFYFIAGANDFNFTEMPKLGFDAAIINLTGRMQTPYKKRNIFLRAFHYFFRLTLFRPLLISYKKSLNYLWNEKIDSEEFIIPSLLPNWDHSPRSGSRFFILTNPTPQLFKTLCLRVLNGIKNKKNKIIFVKSWNEWGEGNYMEPDMQFGKGYIKALAEAKKEIYP
ncbi:MAG: glycoside hydrolase family 99-like domain-containing protein [Fibrobacter sp.]|nr:glycoside hydrolase family 99-like domain-containing protein [Fibrobacter sp.]